MTHLEQVRQSEPNGVMYRDAFLNVDFGLIPTGGNNTAHAPALIETTDGGMLCAWFAGSFEGSGDISIVVSKLDPKTQRWSIPVTVSEGVDRSEQNPSFFRAPDGKIWLIYTSQVSRQEGKTICSLLRSSWYKNQLMKDKHGESQKFYLTKRARLDDKESRS